MTTAPEFLAPHFLLLLLLVPLAVLFFIWREGRRRAALRRIGDPALIAMLTGQISSTRRRVKSGLWLLALAALIIALARPAWGVEVQMLEAEGVAVMIVLDVSRSMDAEDLRPSRLERAKLDLQLLLNELEGHEVGLITFADTAHVYLPLTSDLNAARIFLSSVSTGMTTRQGTAIPIAIQTALSALAVRPTAQQVIILVSDGENHEGEPLAAARQAAEAGVPIYTLGYGLPDGALIPWRGADGALISYHTDAGGSLVETRLEETLLQEIAASSGGFYQRADAGGAAITSLAVLINGLESGTLGERATMQPAEHFHLFLMLAVLALSLEMLLPETRREVRL